MRYGYARLSSKSQDYTGQIEALIRFEKCLVEPLQQIQRKLRAKSQEE